MIWLIGSGPMSVDYAKVLSAQDHDYLIIGRGKASAEDFTAKTGKEVIQGGLEFFLRSKPALPNAAIISVGVAQLFEITLKLIEYGVNRILVEKPGGMTEVEIQTLNQRSLDNACKVYVAYNRRFFASVQTVKEKIIEEGGVTSFNFELTEWAHVIENITKPQNVLKKWFLANSTHIADLAFFLGGKPKEIQCFVSGSLSWHPSSSIMSGAGITENKALFTYSANWESAGRWAVEVLTQENRYILRPVELLQVQKRGTIPYQNVTIEDSLDRLYKPGLYKQVEAFISDNTGSLCTLQEHLGMFGTYEKMAGYSL